LAWINWNPIVLFGLPRDHMQMFEFHKETQGAGNVGGIRGPPIDLEMVCKVWAKAARNCSAKVGGWCNGGFVNQ
jgi:hypothetical protein